MTKRLGWLATGVLAISGIAAADTLTGSVTVNAADDIYYAGQGSADGNGNVPTAIIDLTSDNDFLTFSSVTGSFTCPSSEGCITINGGGSDNDPDGTGAAPSTSSETGANGISGMTAPDAGFLVGVFLDGTAPVGDAAANLDFTSIGTSFTSLSPELDQAFFIGDGLTGDGTGSVQTFYVPSGATELVLGISDACNYNGNPGCYGDNSGTYSVNYSADETSSTTTPEPASVLLVLGGLGLVGAARRKLAR